MNAVSLSFVFSLVIIMVLLTVIVYLLHQRASDRAAKGHESDLPSSSDGTVSGTQTEIHPPAPLLQPELGLVDAIEARYRRREGFFSYQERKFYDLLKEMLDADQQVFAKVRMADLVELTNSPKDKGRYINWILTRHIDFVVCDMRHNKPLPLLGIELNDSSHRRYDRKESDKFKESVFKQVGLTLLWFDVGTYTKTEVQEQVRQVLDAQTANRPGNHAYL